MLSVATEKTIASSRSGIDMFKFFDLGTKLVEAENGYSVNEPVNYAVRAAIEAGVVELINEGERRGLWKFKSETKREDVVLAKPVAKVIVKKPEVVEKPEVAAVEKKVEPKIKVVPLRKIKPKATVTKRSVDKDVIPLPMALPEPKPTLVERICNPEIMKITDVCARDKEQLRKFMKVGIEKHVTYEYMMSAKNMGEYRVCNGNNLCFRNIAEMYRWEAWTKWLDYVNKDRNFNLIK